MTVNFKIDPNSPVPLYHQIRDELRQRILSGELRPGDLLPGEFEICNATGVSRMTARLALSQLANQGMVVRQRGRGSFVASPKPTFRDLPATLLSYTEIMKRLGLQAGAKIVSKQVIPADRIISDNLKVAEGDLVVCLVRLRSAGSEVMAFETSFYPERLFPDLVDHDLTDQSLYQVFKERYNIVPEEALDTLEISVADTHESKMLRVAEGIPVVLFTRKSFTADGVQIEYSKTIHRADRFRSESRVSRSDLLR